MTAVFTKTLVGLVGLSISSWLGASLCLQAAGTILLMVQQVSYVLYAVSPCTSLDDCFFRVVGQPYAASLLDIEALVLYVYCLNQVYIEASSWPFAAVFFHSCSLTPVRSSILLFLWYRVCCTLCESVVLCLKKCVWIKWYAPLSVTNHLVSSS